MEQGLFSRRFIEAVQEFYDDWKEENPGTRLPDFEDAIVTAKDKGVLPESEWPDV